MEQEVLRESQKVKVPEAISERLKRGEKRMKEDSSKREECWRFTRGQQYVHTHGGELVIQPMTTNISERKGKLPWRVRAVRNLIFDIVEREVAMATSRTPSYEVTPSTSDPEDISAARLSEKVALYGHDQWRVRAVTEDAVRHAIIADGGYVWPFFDNSIGPFVETEEGRVGMGDIRYRIFGGNEVGWEPGIRFAESRWHFIKQARDPETVYAMEGYVGGKLELDGSRGESENKKDAKLVLVTEYLERPSEKHPYGRWLTIANDRVIVPERPYPCADEDGEPLDEPILHQLTYARDPDNDRDQGLVSHLLDPARNANLAVSKTLEWMKLALNPQAVIWNGSLAEGQRITDEPGAIYNAFGSGKFEWRPVPEIPAELFTVKDQAEADMAKIAGQNDIPSNLEAGKAIQALIERDQSRRSTFIANLADFYSRLMRHSLYLVARHYTDERLLKVRGRFGPEPIKDFRGSQLRSQVDVRVFPASIEPRTKQSVEQKVMNYAQLGWITPEQAMAASNSGTAENLIQSYELHYARANSVIQKIKDGSFENSPMRPVLSSEEHYVPVYGEDGEMVMDPMGQPVMELATEVPEWMPRPFDNIRVHKQQLEDWMCTSDWDSLDPAGKEAGNLYYQTLLDLEAQQAQREAMMQQQQAEGLGMANAAAPQEASPLPSLPGMNGDQTTSGTPA